MVHFFGVRDPRRPGACSVAWPPPTTGQGSCGLVWWGAPVGHTCWARWNARGAKLNKVAARTTRPTGGILTSQKAALGVGPRGGAAGWRAVEAGQFFWAWSKVGARYSAATLRFKRGVSFPSFLQDAPWAVCGVFVCFGCFFRPCSVGCGRFLRGLIIFFCLRRIKAAICRHGKATMTFCWRFFWDFLAIFFASPYHPLPFSRNCAHLLWVKKSGLEQRGPFFCGSVFA